MNLKVNLKSESKGESDEGDSEENPEEENPKKTLLK